MPGQLLRVDVGDLTFDVRADGPEDGRPVLLLLGFPQTSTRSSCPGMRWTLARRYGRCS